MLPPPLAVLRYGGAGVGVESNRDQAAQTNSSIQSNSVQFGGFHTRAGHFRLLTRDHLKCCLSDLNTKTVFHHSTSARQRQNQSLLCALLGCELPPGESEFRVPRGRLLERLNHLTSQSVSHSVSQSQANGQQASRESKNKRS